jgi:hypothetical protein
MPLRAPDARKLIRRLLDDGRFVSPGPRSHARKEMDADGLSDVDAVNVLRAGVVREAEWENGSWRYRVETQKMVFVVVIEPDPDDAAGGDDDLAETELRVVTAWRMKP